MLKLVKNTGGRPPAVIDQKVFEGLCRIQCTQIEICDWFNVDDMTLNKWCKRTYKKGFSDVYRQKRGTGKISLRRSMWQEATRAEKPNIVMQIWLSKQHLDMKDKHEISGDQEAPISLCYQPRSVRKGE